MTMPNFLVIGAAKSGTDALCDYLGQHPEIYMCPNKEPNFFVAQGQSEIPFRGNGDRDTLREWDMWVWSLDRYQALFDNVCEEKAIGEGTTWYLYDESAPRRIHKYIPQVKLIAILRNPVDRAYSAYTMLLRDGRETITNFAQALAAENERIHKGWEPLWHYARQGLYFQQLKRYYNSFSPTQIDVVLYDDFNTRPREVLHHLYRFLAVDENFEPDMSIRHNVSMVPRYYTLHRLIVRQNPLRATVRAMLPTDLRRRIKSRIQSHNLSRPESVSLEIRHQLVEFFRADILDLAKLLDRDLSSWLQ